MSAESVPSSIRSDVTKDQMIDIAAAIRLGRNEAGQVVKNTPLKGPAEARAAGYLSHEIIEHRLAETVRQNGGVVINGETFPGTELRNYQVLGGYGRVLIGKASITQSGELPTRNITRGNGVKFNKKFSAKPDIPGLIAPTESDGFIYVTILTCRDRNDVTQFHEVAVSVIESDFSGYAFYEEIDTFILGYGSGEAAGEKDADPGPVGLAPMGIELRNDAKPFIGGEVAASQNESGEAKEG